MKKKMGIKTRLVLAFTAFIVFLLFTVWLLQIFLLSFFYKNTKEKELDTALSMLESSVETDSLEETAYNIAAGYAVCVRVFKIKSGVIGDEICSVEDSAVCLIHHLPTQVLEKYVSKASASGGELIETISLGSSLIESDISDSVPDAFPEAPETEDSQSEESPVPPEQAPENAEKRTSGSRMEKRLYERDTTLFAVATKLITDSDTTGYVIFLNTAYTPLDSTVSTLNTLFVWIACTTIVAGVALAYLLARTISSPLERMTKAAAKLASGDYSPDFRVEGYRETRELASTLNFAASEISKTDRLQKELIANVSHDLRTPLTMISGYAEVMRDIPGENTPENVQVIIDESKRLASLVNDLLDLSKIESGTKKPEMTEFSLTHAIDEIMERYTALKSHDGYKISFSKDSEAYIRADRTMTGQVIYNLINNAINYTGEDKTVNVIQTVSPDGKRVRITVNDTGEGIAPENISSIWERYYKVDKVHRRAQVGTGLGLSIVRNILQLHGASFGVESALGVGSSFWFEMDTVQPPEAG